MIMSTPDKRKFAFLGSKHPEIQKAMIDFFIKLGATNRQKLLCRNKDMYYFINETNKIDCSLILPEGYIHQLQTYLNIMKNQEDKVPEYVECVEEQPQHNNYGELGKIYKVLNWNCSITDCMLVGTTSGSTAKKRFKPSTKEAYDAQNNPLKAAEYIPQVGDYVVMEKAGGWGHSPDNNGCVALVSRIGKTIVEGVEVPCIWGEIINPNTIRNVKFSNIPQFGYDKEVIFRKTLPYEIPINTSQEKPQQVEEWSIGTYAVGIKGNFGLFSGPNEKLSIGSIFTIIGNSETNNSVGVKESIYWIYKENLKWFATHTEALDYSTKIKHNIPLSPEDFSSKTPLEICKEKYKKGMKVRSALESGFYSEDFIIDVDPSEFYNTGEGVDYFGSKGWLYIYGRFADILEEPLTRENKEFHLELERRTQYPITPESAFPVKALRKQLKIVKFQEVHEIKTVEEKLLKKTKSKLFNI